MARDTNIGIPQEKTLMDIHNKLDEVEKKVDDVVDGLDENVNVLRQSKTVSELILGHEVEGEE